MPFRKISRDVKVAAVNLYERELIPLDDILDCCRLSRSTFFRILRLWRTTGDVIKYPYSNIGRPRVLVANDVQYLLRLVRHRPDWFLDELADLLLENRFISVHFSTICRELEHAGFSLKKLKKIASERSEIKRSAFVYRMAEYTPEQLGFIDETSKDDRVPGRRRGRAKKGQRAKRKQVFVRGHRLTATGLMTVNGMVAYTVIEGSMTGESFLEFLHDNVVCTPEFEVLLLIN
jgi:transposase